MMLRDIPAFVTEVDASAEGRRSVDDAEFFVVGASERMAVIENEVNARMQIVPDSSLPGLALQNVEVGVIPHQEVKVEAGFALDEPKYLFLERLECSGFRARVTI